MIDNAEKGTREEGDLELVDPDALWMPRPQFGDWEALLDPWYGIPEDPKQPRSTFLTPEASLVAALRGMRVGGSPGSRQTDLSVAPANPRTRLRQRSPARTTCSGVVGRRVVRGRGDRDRLANLPRSVAARPRVVCHGHRCGDSPLRST